MIVVILITKVIAIWSKVRGQMSGESVGDGVVCCLLSDLLQGSQHDDRMCMPPDQSSTRLSGVLAFQFPYAFSDATVFDLDYRCRRLQRGDLVLMLTIACQSAVTRGRVAIVDKLTRVNMSLTLSCNLFCDDLCCFVTKPSPRFRGSLALNPAFSVPPSNLLAMADLRYGGLQS